LQFIYKIKSCEPKQKGYLTSFNIFSSPVNFDYSEEDEIYFSDKIPGNNEENENSVTELAENRLYDELSFYMRENPILKDEDPLIVWSK
jgi:hypothetical protein